MSSIHKYRADKIFHILNICAFSLLIFVFLTPAYIYGESSSGLTSTDAKPDPPELSHTSGFYTHEFSVTVSHPDSSVLLLYTLDGSIPTLENTEGKVWTYKRSYAAQPGDPPGELFEDTVFTFIYSDPVPVADISSAPDRYADIAASYFINEDFRDNTKIDSKPVFKGVTLRVAAYKNEEYSETVTANFFITSEGENRYSLPVLCITAEPEDLFGYEGGWNVPGRLFDDWRLKNPEKPAELWTPANFRNKGDETERAIHFNYLVNGEEVLNHGAGLRANGNSSRIYPNRSLRLYAKAGYGPKNFKYPFFKGDPREKFKRLILRNAGQDTEDTMLRDALIHRATKDLKVDVQAYQPVIVFINGEYWGLYNLRERYDKKYFDEKYGIDEGELDFIKAREVAEGDDIDLLALDEFLENHSLENTENYQLVTDWVDIENVIDYHIVEIFAGNMDWPQSNVDSWRKRVPYDSLAPQGHDGRWRWILKDLDYSLGKRWNGFSYHLNDFQRVTIYDPDNPQLNRGSLLLRRLLENETFRHQFIRRYADLLNSYLKSEVLSALGDSLVHQIAPEMEEFISRWNPAGENNPLPWSPVASYRVWQKNTEDLLLFLEKRQEEIRDHLSSGFDHLQTYNLSLNLVNPHGGHLQVNTLHIRPGLPGVDPSSPYPWTGTYFSGIPLSVIIHPAEGFEFSHWEDAEGNVIDSIRVLTLSPEKNLSLFAFFEGDHTSSVQVPPADENISIYPNPFSHEIKIVSDQPLESYSLYSLQGQLIRQGNIQSSKLDTEALLPGLYILHLKTRQQTFVKKLIKM